MLKSKIERKREINFLLESREYKRLHFYLYLASIMLIALFYFVIVMLFSSISNYFLLTAGFSLIVGLFLVFKRDHLVRKLGDYMYEKKRKNLKKQHKEGYKTSMRNITPKRKDFNPKILSKEPLSYKIKKMLFVRKQNKEKLEKSKDKKPRPDYIEIKD